MQLLCDVDKMWNYLACEYIITKVVTPVLLMQLVK